jgi:hypothetical protein
VNALLRRLISSIFMVLLVGWVLLQLLPPALPFLIALWVLSIFGTALFAKSRW